MLPLAILLQLAVTNSMPQVTLAEALRRATALDPGYVAALGRVDNAEWGRRAARLVFILPAVSARVDATKYSTSFFNIGTGTPQSTSVTAELDAQYELLSLRKLADLSRTGAQLRSAEAGEVKARFSAALFTESDYYAVLANEELSRVAAERVSRAEEQLVVARARVVSGAAVQTDSLQLMLELSRARVEQLRQDAALRVARLQLGRRVGEAGPVDAAPLDASPAPPLPLTLPELVQAALETGPEYQAARADEIATAAALRGQRGTYLPQLNLSASHVRFDDHFFPNARAVSSITLGVSLPIWNNGQREIAVTQARVNRDVSRAIRADLQLAAQRDVTEAYEAYNTARATTDLSETSQTVAQENFRVQQSRYRAGATTILDLLDAQLSLTQAQADLVRSRYANRLALAGLEAILGTRLFPTPAT
ncbi:MAG: TolC family protein [Gemmatimonadales bacterium]